MSILFSSKSCNMAGVHCPLNLSYSILPMHDDHLIDYFSLFGDVWKKYFDNVFFIVLSLDQRLEE